MLLRNLKQLQAYPEFRTPEGINQVRTAILNNAAPAGLSINRRNRFNQKFRSGNFVVENTDAEQLGNPAYGLNRLKYRVGPNRFLVAYPDERDFYLQRIWNDPTRGYGVGLQAFYLQVAQTHLNIQKKYTDTFLKGKGDYQIQKNPIKKVNKPITSKTSNERWQMDLIDMSLGNYHIYILTVVDNFSGFIWTRRILQKNGVTTVNALQDILDTDYPQGSSGTAPRLLQSDRGPEFNNVTVRNFCAENNTTQILTKSYSPSSNGKVERKNREIRKKIKAGFIRQNANTWNAASLDQYTQNINRQVDSRSKFRPIDLYETNYTPPAAETPPPPVPLTNYSTEQQIQNNNWNYHRTRAIRLTNGTRNVYLVGDLVRVVFREVSAAYRRIRKERKFENKLVVHYSPTISRVTEVVQPNDRTRFVVMYSIAVGGPDGLPPPVNTETWTMAADIPVLFTGNQLVPAGNTVSIAPRDEPRANYMNSRN